MIYSMPEYHPRIGPIESLIGSISRKGLSNGLKLCLDIGDSVSYPFGSGQTWFDRSGNAVDFFRGASSSVQTSDPTPNGSAGDFSKNTYWSFDGGDYFQANTAASGYSAALAGWISNIHKDGAKFTFFAWFYPAVTGTFCMLGTSGAQAAADRGFQWWSFTGNNNMGFALKHGFGGVGDANQFTIGAWNCVALSIDEALGTNNATFFSNGAFSIQNCDYVGSDTGNATNTIMVGGTGNTGDLRGLTNGSRLSQIAVWEGVALTQAQIGVLYDATKTRFK
ncbi:hypothetical protein EN828_20465 [Mesorhizobium sp. M2D.F.Ca.ET.185.01.1.1]|uniref:LamG-like jellyroll fold domain-containing protein n=1 Tax=unclassified Mesorhizobium TaxID=325217 RepID=UPI000FCB9C0F|nr:MULTISPECIES: LamG-like jellyroll fold domain-containing protein [unclassified Mesorhizobium]TGP78841.1 hypothetical protein EN870_15270 [bacterium M00.F.Ca.ET.227.01.1.1]TGP89630.1 hypothetical protein EN864_21075 [bacterium M00.F.Ca.ET.221.01.1.1]TGP94997.1 hypothetical protein EN865_16945 [bacterium M00.F.Ca.ET.222.01.1.1]TGU02496.1 hypothetical protein EN806_45190 [bacterium M00.F.Ca.ET.163.01.1.1]TGU19000.1 hypothetical protein EN799_59425 [bacterium M00.F.Ca.ET.156.01.1.1]TGU45986.1 